MNKHKSNFPEQPSTGATASDWSYEATLAKIEGIIAQIESGQLDLAAVFDQFSIAAQMLQQCEMFLKQRQQQMDLLVEVLEEPND